MSIKPAAALFYDKKRKAANSCSQPIPSCSKETAEQVPENLSFPILLIICYAKSFNFRASYKADQLRLRADLKADCAVQSFRVRDR